MRELDKVLLDEVLSQRDNLCWTADVSAYSEASYGKLLSDLRRVLKRMEAHQPVEQQVLLSHWNLGRRLLEANILESAAYGEVIIKRLADDLSLGWRNLYRALSFAREYAEPPRTGLSWSHYRELLAVSDPSERSFYEQLALEEGLSRDRLVAALKADLYGSGESKQGGVKLKRPREPRYVFPATLERVIDGDTLLLVIDVGFEILKAQRVRLAAINALSASSKKGREATAYVAERLERADRIVVQTKRADLHGRYLAHVFYSTRSLGMMETFERGRYLNQELVDRKLAMPHR